MIVSLSRGIIGDILRKYWRPFEDKEDKMKTLAEHNSQMMEKYGLEGRKWRESDVLCPKCEPAVVMHEQVGVILTTNPPKIKVRCSKCSLESYKIV